MDNFTRNRFYLLGRGMLRAVRAVWRLYAVVQFLYKFLYHLALDRRCDLMFWLPVFWTVVSFSNVWNKNHLRITSHCKTQFCYCYVEKMW